MNYQPHLLGVSDHVANAIANRLLDDVRAKDQYVEEHGFEIDARNIFGSMRNPKSQERSHRRIVKAFQPLVVDHSLLTGSHRFQSSIVNLAEANGWVFNASHRGVGIRIDVICCEGRGKKLRAFSIMAAVIDWHLLPRFIQRAGLADYDALLWLVKAWSNALISDDGEEFLDIANWLHDERRRVLIPVLMRGKVCAILTGSETGIGIKHPVLRAITLLSHDMLTADEVSTIMRLTEKPYTLTRLEAIQSLPQRNGHLAE